MARARQDVTDIKRAAEENASHLSFLESMDRINRAMQVTSDLEQMMSVVLEEVLEIFTCDRAWLIYPCDPDAPYWRAAMELWRPEFPGAFALGTEMAMDAEVATVFRRALASDGAVPFGPAYELPVPEQVAERFSIRSQITIAVHPKLDKPYLFGLHQCSRSRVWTAQEKRLFQEIARRLADALTSLLMFRSLRESERKLEEAQRIAHVGYWEHDFDTGRVALSDETCRIFGLQPQGITAEPLWDERWSELIHPEDRERIREAHATALNGNGRYDVEYRLLHLNGEVRIVHSRGDVTRDESGRPVRMFGMTQDITELRRAEEELRASEARFRMLVDFAGDAFMLHDKDGTVLDVNRQACESMGYTREELIGMRPIDFDPNASAVLAGRLGERFHAGEIVTFESLCRRKDGSLFPVEVRVRELPQSGRRLSISLARDITERKRVEAERAKLEERLRQAEKMEAIGRFASGIAHDFNNVLGGILAYGEMLFDDAPEKSTRKRYAQNVLSAATRGRELIDQILAYSRSQRGKHMPTDVCPVVNETLELVRSSLPATVVLQAGIPDTPIIVMGNATQLHQVVMNLCTNAIDAMTQGGKLRVAVAPVEMEGGRALSHGTVKAGRYARLTVEDTGCGMDEGTFARIFEPFFTTKEAGHGTGLGLALVYGIVNDLDGTIDVGSVPGRGTSFAIYLPLADRVAPAAASA